jgi:hypothetical protein
VISSALQPEHFKRSLNPRDREILTERTLEVSYFFEVLRDPFREPLFDRASKRQWSSFADAASKSMEQGDSRVGERGRVNAQGVDAHSRDRLSAYAQIP